MWYTVKDFATLKGISDRAVQKALKEGRLKGRHDTSVGGRGIWFVWVDVQTNSNEPNEPEKGSNEPNELSNELQPSNELSNEPVSNEPNELSNDTPCSICKSSHSECNNCCRTCVSRCNAHQYCHILVEHCKRAAIESTDSVCNWSSIYDKLIKTSFLLPSHEIPLNPPQTQTIAPGNGAGISDIDSSHRKTDCGVLHSVPAVSSSPNLSPVTSHLSPDSPSANDGLLPTPYSLLPSAGSAYSHLELRTSDFTPTASELPEKYDLLARMRAGLCLMYLDSPISRLSERMEFIVRQYNAGLLCPELRDMQGEISPRTLHRWLSDYKSAARDYRVLAPGYRVPKRANKQIQDDVNAVLGALLRKDRKKQSLNAILDQWEYLYRTRNQEPPCSRKTIERRIKDWIYHNQPTYILATQGQKGFDEKISPAEILDYSLLKFMDYVLADGKVLNFFIINPHTGKPARPMLITFFEVTSRMPIGFSLDWTENYRSIGAAYRNACLYVGFIPKWIKFDNGFAFTSQAIMGRGDRHGRPADKLTLGDTELDHLSGLLYRSGVEYVSLAQPYNGKGKAPLERWHGTLNTKLESLLPAYSGSNIFDKPSSQNRNEAWLRKMKNNEPLTLQEAKLVIDFWVTQQYANLPHPALKGATPNDAFRNGLQMLERSALSDESVAKRKITNRGDFNYLMLSTEIKTLSNNGVKINGLTYYHECMLPYVGQKVIVRYDVWEDRIITLYDDHMQYIGCAGERQLSHPMASQAGPVEQGQLTNRLKFKNRAMSHYKRAVQNLHQQFPGINVPALAMNHELHLTQDSPLKQLADSHSSLMLREGGTDVPGELDPLSPVTSQLTPDVPIYTSEQTEINELDASMEELVRDAYKDFQPPTDDDLLDLQLSHRLG